MKLAPGLQTQLPWSGHRSTCAISQVGARCRTHWPLGIQLKVLWSIRQRGGAMATIQAVGSDSNGWM